MNLQEIMIDAMDIGELKLAHFIYWASTQGVPLDGDFSSLKQLSPDQAEIERLTRDNFLGANPIRVYSYKKRQDFHLCLARNQVSAKSCISLATNEFNPNVAEVPGGIYQELSFGDENLSLFEYRDRCIEFPHYIGIYRKD